MSEMSTVTGKLTYETYLELPETKQRYDIVDGVLQFMSPAPTVKHQSTIGRLHLALAPFVHERDLGEVYLSPCDIIISRKPLRTRQPDLFYVSKARFGILRDQVEGAPDLVVEILSPGNTAKHVQAKLEDYARLGVPECWILAPKSKTLEVLFLANGKYRSAGSCSPGNPVPSRALPGFVLPAEVFE